MTDSMSSMSHEELELVVDKMMDRCFDLIHDNLKDIPCPVDQNAAVSCLGFAIASSTLRNVTDERSAKLIASELIISFTRECAALIAEIWSSRENPQ